jgi:formiminotetrahydrofolate cyclodeaminase
LTKLLDLPLEEFLDLVASEKPAPGGGSMAAQAAAGAAALMAMVCRLTIGKKKYVDVEQEAKEGLADLEKWRIVCQEQVDADAAAYNEMAAAFRLPKETEEEKLVRLAAIQQAAKGAAAAPARTLEAAFAIAEWIARLFRRTNQNCLSDASPACIWPTGRRGRAALNVLINLSATAIRNSTGGTRTESTTCWREWNRRSIG